MNGKRYYITTLGDWQRHAARFANSHFIVLDPRAATMRSTPESNGGDILVGARYTVPGNDPWRDAAHPATPSAGMGGESVELCQASSPGMTCHAPTDEMPAAPDADARILVLIEADEGVHLSLEDDPAFEALPHPLAQTPISDAAQSALAAHGVAPGATTFDAAEAVARVHPLLRHRVF